MKAVIAIFILISLFFSISAFNRHTKPKELITYEDVEVLGGLAIINMILLGIITLLFIFT